MTLVILIGGIDLSVGAGIALTGVVAAKLQIDHHQPAWRRLPGRARRRRRRRAVARPARHPRRHAAVHRHARRLPRLSRHRARALRRARPVADGRRLPAPRRRACRPRLSMGICVGAGVVGARASCSSRQRRRRALGLPTDALAAHRAARSSPSPPSPRSPRVIYQDGMPVPVLIAAVAVAAGAILLRRTRLGRYAFAIGGNAEAARLSGVPVVRVTIAHLRPHRPAASRSPASSPPRAPTASRRATRA